MGDRGFNAGRNWPSQPTPISSDVNAPQSRDKAQGVDLSAWHFDARNPTKNSGATWAGEQLGDQMLRFDLMNRPDQLCVAGGAKSAH
jgi:hypothetical protein